MYYIEITLLPTFDISSNYLLSRLFIKLHKRLTSLQNQDGSIPIGLSFPEYSITPPNIGNKIRLFTEQDILLTNLDLRSYLKSFLEYIHITGIRESPKALSNYVQFKRVQMKSSVDRIARRKANRKGITIEEAKRALGNLKEEMSELPFIRMRSSSSNESFFLFIERKTTDSVYPFIFNTYGLTKGGSVPDF